MNDVQKTLDERGARYGDFGDHARIAQRLQGVMRSGANPSGHELNSKEWERLSDVQKQALTVIADKIARILSGDPNYGDNWHDIQGYAKLAEDRLPKTAAPNDALPDEEFVGGWHAWDCHAPQANLLAGPPVQPGFYIKTVKYTTGETVEVQGRPFLWDASPLPEQRIVAYCVERLP